MNLNPREIKGAVELHNRHPEKEKVSRWSFLKVLREHSDLLEFYPEINPYAECYKFRENTYCIFVPSAMASLGDMWNYLIIGPEKALLIDTALGLGNIRALAEHLAGGKEVICVNTHNHVDHIGGNYYFDKVYINEYDVEGLKRQMTPDYFPSRLLDENGQPKDAEFDPAYLAEFKEYEVVGVPDGYTFDLGDGYEVELMLLSGHTAGQSGLYDKQTGCFFIGDTTSALKEPGEKHPELCTVRSLRDHMQKALDKYGEQMTGIFPGHGAIDLHPVTLQYIIDTADRIIAHPDWYDTKVQFFEHSLYAKMIYQFGSDLKYSMDTVE
ncbi:MAG: MBL fold metallo-hydrolase [Erysipelotrichaceae bacterium]|nr:MBL fold metallo-hydrolase [Erysipelotrichaceae bacterium]